MLCRAINGLHALAVATTTVSVDVMPTQQQMLGGRYYNFWMPLAAECFQRGKRANWEGSKALLPSFDVQWVWHCHRLNPMAYRKYCSTVFHEVIDFPMLSDAESEASARDRCRKLWIKRYPKEPFDILPQIRKLATGQVYPIDEQSDDNNEEDEAEENQLVSAIARQSSFYFQVSQPYMWDERFLRAALQRYKCFLHILRKSEGKILCVPTYDIDLMWHSHQLSPLAYANDTHALLGCVMDHDDTLEKGPNTKLDQGFQDTARLWENTFGQPYEKAGSMSRGTQPLSPTPLPSDDGGFERVPVALPWSYQPKDVNQYLKILSPRYVVEVCLLIKSAVGDISLKEGGDLFLRLKALDAHKLMKLDIPLFPGIRQPQWQKLWLLQCEVSTRGVILELRCHVRSCFKSLATTTKLGESVLSWQELQESSLLSVDRVFQLKDKKRQLFHDNHALSQGAALRLGASITPSVPAPYLLKSVPDRVTDDQGEMISTLYLRMRRNQPQEGRWMSRTVLDHRGKECFVIRIRAAKGIWRKGKDRPVGVDWNERVIHICEGGWNYISGFIGKAPVKVVGTAIPFADDLGQYKLRWSLSSGEMLTISRPMEELNWESNLIFSLDGSSHGLVRLLNGRKLAYQVPGATADDEEGFVTLVRHTPDAPQGKATALFNWKLSAMEIYPEEDVLLVLLLCTSTLRSVADLGGKNYENLYARRRAKETKPGLKDWGSVVIENPRSQSNLMLWYVNPGNVLSSEEGAPSTGVLGSNDAADGCGNCASSCGVGVDWEGGKSFAEETSSYVGFGGGIGGRQDRRTGSGVQLEGIVIKT
ncbi:hypothetical protein AXG93_3964s1050 [Marchantia polymorpha subsp. ruderalis]|uniref:GRPD C-terminal domain-containing protein n=1 Tax=Marchantia polymorpha subsp. ruderalis TaxID=1480154 RepID=A0A176WD39_MARPO|nr:hypothetical protein AXG93_3964s1050 [Marchantia polymorpha subsp. ruderalis]